MLGRHGQGGGVILPGVQEAGLASGGVGCFPNVIHDFIKKTILYLFLYFVHMCSHMPWCIYVWPRVQLFFIMWVPDMALSSSGLPDGKFTH